MNLEYGHIYVEDMMLNGWEESILKNIEKEKDFFNNFSGKKIVLIDDKDFNLTNEQKKYYESKVSETYAKIGLKPDHIYFEKIYSKNSEELFDSIDENYKYSIYFKKEDKYVDFIKTPEANISVRERKNGTIKNYCVLLSTAWSIYKEEQYGNNHLVLPKHYKKVETNVSLLLQILKKPNNNTYFYY